MTTIAWDGKTLAADTQVTSGSIVVGHECKLQDLGDGRWLAATGCTADSVLAERWLTHGGDKPELGDPDGFEALYWNGTQMFVVWAELVPVPWGSIRASGSGFTWAMAAMDMGKTAIEAVEYAMTRDTGTGGTVDSVILRPDCQ